MFELSLEKAVSAYEFSLKNNIKQFWDIVRMVLLLVTAC